MGEGGDCQRTRVLLVTDAWLPNLCGVTRKAQALEKELQAAGCDVLVIHPELFPTLPLLGFMPEVHVALAWPPRLARMITAFDPHYINIMTECVLGLTARFVCDALRRAYTTMYCTRMAEYAALYWLTAPFASIIRRYFRWFHARSRAVITPSASMADMLREQEQLTGVVAIPNGCDTSAFTPDGPRARELEAMKRPIWLYVGRLGREKNVEALLQLDALPGTRVLVGAGPRLQALRRRFAAEDVHFLGWRSGQQLSALYRSADVFVFPSRTDTFGQVMVEAMASGLPVAAHPVTGPRDVVRHGRTGALHDDLHAACRAALKDKDSSACIAHARSFSWQAMAARFMQTVKDACAPRARQPDSWLAAAAAALLSWLP
eukprot:PLAT6043.2.p1 GENE.PLAT6043.2~~PLAT6043.2.p1  ORF type:complete len:393 (-),score=165.97 PLAT6043.2:30-1157(-)